MSDKENTKQGYSYYLEISLRWKDNDIYGHVNNVNYYSYFDTTANQYLIENGGFNIQNADVVGFVVASKCEYLAPISYPGTITVGLKANKIGTKSVEYGLAIFDGDNQQASAIGTFTHVYVNRQTGKSVEMPSSFRSALEKII